MPLMSLCALSIQLLVASLRRLFYVLPCLHCLFFFFQAEDGIRDLIVTGVQTCALPIYVERLEPQLETRALDAADARHAEVLQQREIEVGEARTAERIPRFVADLSEDRKSVV